MNRHNKTTAYDMALLCCHALKNSELFVKIVGTKVYDAEITNRSGISNEI